MSEDMSDGEVSGTATSPVKSPVSDTIEIPEDDFARLKDRDQSDPGERSARKIPTNQPDESEGRKSAKSSVLERFSVGIAAITLIINSVGLWFVVEQLRQTSESISANTLEQIYGRMHDINKLFIEHPELKPYFYENLDIGQRNTVAERLGRDMPLVEAQVLPLSETMCDFFAQALIELKHLPPQAYDGWKTYIQAVYKRSPAMRRYYRENKQWYQYADAAILFDQADRELAQQIPGKPHEK